MAFIRDAKPRLVKILDNFGPAAEIKAASPGTGSWAASSSPPSRGWDPASAPRSGGIATARGSSAIRRWTTGRATTSRASAACAVQWYAQFEAARVACWPRTAGRPASATSRRARPTSRPRDLARLLPGDRRCHGQRRHPGPPRVRHAHAAVLRRRERRGVAVRPVSKGLPASSTPRANAAPRHHRNRRRRRCPGLAKPLHRGAVHGPAEWYDGVLRGTPTCSGRRCSRSRSPAGIPSTYRPSWPLHGSRATGALSADAPARCSSQKRSSW